ncbi:DUF6479 family protein [Streptomyces sp. NPDC047108]|uniref:DUF6479 family protein n=1 Tax=Streptomyces sp. NPDC047108 TaxID=3155025 RepID=UPI0033E6AD25
MFELTMEFAARRDYLVGIGPLVVGIFVVLLLVGAVILGLRVRSREPEPPKDPQPRGGAWGTHEEHESGNAPPNHGPGHQDEVRPRTDFHERRRPHDVPHNGVRHMPYEFDNTPSESAADEGEPESRKWDRGGSGHGTG